MVERLLSCFILVFTNLALVGCRINKGEEIRGYLPKITYSKPYVDNVPYAASEITDLAAVIYGSDVQTYTYKLGPQNSVNCKSPLNYSAEIATTSWITADISSMPDGWVRLCVRGKNSDGNFTPYAIATEKVWYKETSPTPLTVQIKTPDDIDYEKNKSITLTFEMSGTKAYDVVVTYRVDGTLTIGEEYSVSGVNAQTHIGSSTIKAGATTATTIIKLFQDSVSGESDEYVTVTLASVTGSQVSIGPKDHFRADVLSDVRIPVDSLSAGRQQACGIFAGSLRCWGSNVFAQLGDGTIVNRPTSVEIDTGVNYSVASTGNTHSCGVTVAGDLKCWGSNTNGQIGDGTTTQRTTPVVIDSGVKYKSVSTGGLASSQHTCGITTAGVLKCWGWNTNGQIGDGTTTQRTTPVVIDSGVSYSSVALGSAHTCGVTAGGSLKCWGDNSSGQIGDGTITQRTTPVAVDSSASYNSVELGLKHSCGITTSRALKCWGSNTNSQIGDGTQSDHLTPIVIDADTEYLAITLGELFSCGILPNGAFKCWGSNNYGQLGTGSSQIATSAVDVENEYTYTSVSTGNTQSCAITSSGTLKCWGTNSSGQVGDGTTQMRLSPIIVDQGVSYKEVSSSPLHTCGITVSGILKCWGGNSSGQLGDGTTVDKQTPVVIDNGVHYLKVDVGNSHTCAITSAHQLKCWGANLNGQLGDGTTNSSSAPLAIDSSVSYVTVSAGYTHSCGITDANQLKCWGSNLSGQLGDGTTNSSLTPLIVDSAELYSSVDTAVGFSTAKYTCAVTTGGVLKCWGFNSFAQLGDGTTTSRLSPVVIDSGVSYSNVATGAIFTCGVTSSGQVKCWGTNQYGSLGNSAYVQSMLPVLADTGETFTQLSATTASVCGLTTSNMIKCWGILSGGSTNSILSSTPNISTNSSPTLPTVNSIYVAPPTLTPASGGQFTASADFAGDANSDATVRLYYCNQTDSPNCDPAAGTNINLARGTQSYTTSVGPLSAPNDAGDVLKILIVTTDADTAFGSYATTLTLLP